MKSKIINRVRERQERSMQLAWHFATFPRKQQLHEDSLKEIDVQIDLAKRLQKVESRRWYQFWK